MWSGFVFELVIWPKETTLARWTQPPGPLCLGNVYSDLRFASAVKMMKGAPKMGISPGNTMVEENTKFENKMEIGHHSILRAQWHTKNIFPVQLFSWEFVQQYPSQLWNVILLFFILPIMEAFSCLVCKYGSFAPPPNENNKLVIQFPFLIASFISCRINSATWESFKSKKTILKNINYTWLLLLFFSSALSH